MLVQTRMPWRNLRQIMGYARVWPSQQFGKVELNKLKTSRKVQGRNSFGHQAFDPLLTTENFLIVLLYSITIEVGHFEHIIH